MGVYGMSNKLIIELVPLTSWYNNVRSQVSQAEWDVLRKACYKEAGYKCEICGGVGEKWPVECHEIWVYDDDNYKQDLKGLIALCPLCHATKHYGRSKAVGQEAKVFTHFCKVNGYSKKEGKQKIKEAFEQWHNRSESDWSVDISWLGQRINR